MNSPYFTGLILDRTLLDGAVVPELAVSLHSGDPGVDGGHELVGYERQRVFPAKLGASTVLNTNALEFDALPQGEVTHFGVWDAREGGNFLLGGALPAPQRIVRDNQALRWREGEWAFRIGG